MSVYVPPVFAAADRATGWRIAQQHPLALLLLPDGSTSPLPLLCDEPAQRLHGHLARANPASAVPDGAEAKVLFLGPHAYVSPTWYEKPSEQVPTWNYVFVEMAGVLSWVDREETQRRLGEMCARFETEGGYSPAWVDPAQMREMLEEIAGFVIAVRSVQPKLKLSQNRSPADWERVRRQFMQAPSPGPELAEWMSRTRS